MSPTSPADEPRAALARLYREYGHVVVHRGRRLLGSDADAQELLHEVFVTLLSRVAAGEVLELEKPAAFLYAVATRRALTRLRDSSAHARLLGERLAPALDQSPAPSHDRVLELAALLSELSPDELRAIVHFHVDEFTHDEIAEQLKCSRRHVGNLLIRGRRTLRAAAGVLPEDSP